MSVDQILTLSDGRTLGYATFGDPAGVPVIALHGTPGSRFKFADSHEAACRFGLRLLSIDRWGYGLSSPCPGGTLADFGADMVALADALRLGQALVTGVSGGGPYAVATAAAFGSRARALALVSPIGLIDPDTRMSPFHRACFHALPRLRFVIPAAFHAYRAGLLTIPHTTVRLAMSLGPAVDRRTLDDAAIRQRLVDTFESGLRPGVHGAVSDIGLFSRPWGIDFLDVVAPAKIWIGTADKNVPHEAVENLGRALKTAQIERLPGQGHLWIATHSDQVLGWLATHA